MHRFARTLSLGALLVAGVLLAGCSDGVVPAPLPTEQGTSGEGVTREDDSKVLENRKEGGGEAVDKPDCAGTAGRKSSDCN